MPVLSLPLTNRLAQSSNQSTKYRLNISSFGDGYSQRTPDGINYITKSFNIVYDTLTNSEMNQVITFTDTVGDGQYFYFTPPGGSQLKWILAGEVKMVPKAGDLYFVQFPIMQVFDL